MVNKNFNTKIRVLIQSENESITNAINLLGWSAVVQALNGKNKCRKI